ncbi:MAG: sigma-70 family RNA polymerase sigma factor, partial [Clostridia bacterium]|nr:sigma-70 family RNA polymerase sigma factor [Clostridia bacterium]
MNREKAERIIAEYMKPVFGFALKRCKNVHDAEDLSQEIILRAYRALLLRDDIEDAGRFVWTIARNALANYYRDTAKYTVVLSPDVADDGASPFDLLSDAEEKKTLNRLRDEIAYLSKVQRRIVTLYYFENKKLGEIATELDLP